MPCVNGLLGIENSPLQRQGIFAIQELISLHWFCKDLNVWVSNAWEWPLCSEAMSGATSTIKGSWFSNVLKLKFEQHYSQVFSLLFKSYSVCKCRFVAGKHEGVITAYISMQIFKLLTNLLNLF